MFGVSLFATCPSRAVAGAGDGDGAGDNILLLAAQSHCPGTGALEVFIVADPRTPCRIHNPYEQSPWDNMITIKQRILRIWDDAAAAVKLCCIKFAQRVVLAQTTATNMEKVRASLTRYNLDLLEWMLILSSVLMALRSPWG
jgi:hypothetical protein